MDLSQLINKVSSEEERLAKQQKIKDCASAKFSRDDLRHVRITNSIASMICTDVTPTNVVNCEGFKSTVEPRYKVPDYSTFSRSVIPKLKNAVSSFQQDKINKALEKVKLMGLSLDCKDVEQSAVLSFTIYFYDDDQFCCKTLSVEALRVFSMKHRKTSKSRSWINKSNRVRTTDAFSSELPAYLSLNRL